jgi:S-adenosyl-L-homocysteine hydrolase, NAD binding domain/Acetokinase family
MLPAQFCQSLAAPSSSVKTY